MTKKTSEKMKTDFGFVKPVLKLGIFAFLLQFIYERAMIYAVQGRIWFETSFRKAETYLIWEFRRFAGDL